MAATSSSPNKRWSSLPGAARQALHNNRSNHKQQQ
jgi:hypothetical protein